MNKNRAFVVALLRYLVIILIAATVLVLIMKEKGPKTQPESNQGAHIGYIINDETAGTGADYGNSMFYGLIKGLSKDSSGKIVFHVDVIQMLFGKDAFLALAKDYSSGKNKFGDWSALGKKYPTFSALSNAVYAMTDSQFEDFYYSYNDKAHLGEPGTAIFGAFPDGMIYSKNESPKIRTFPADATLKKVTITVGEEFFTPEDLYAVCVDPQKREDSLSEGQNGYVDGHFISFPCSSEILFTTKNGEVTAMEAFYRP